MNFLISCIINKKDFSPRSYASIASLKRLGVNETLHKRSNVRESLTKMLIKATHFN